MVIEMPKQKTQGLSSLIGLIEPLQELFGRLLIKLISILGELRQRPEARQPGHLADQRGIEAINRLDTQLGRIAQQFIPLLRQSGPCQLPGFRFMRLLRARLLSCQL